jgi:DHA2 family multidrug resistance protein
MPKEPVIDFRLLANRNFAIANVLFFVFGLGLFGSTIIPGGSKCDIQNS